MGVAPHAQFLDFLGSEDVPVPLDLCLTPLHQYVSSSRPRLLQPNGLCYICLRPQSVHSDQPGWNCYLRVRLYRPCYLLCPCSSDCHSDIQGELETLKETDEQNTPGRGGTLAAHFVSENAEVQTFGISNAQRACLLRITFL